MKDLKLGIPYMGSKRKLSYEIVSYIMQQNPNCKYFYDLFGGGGAISFQALQHKNIQQVYYNEIDMGVCELLRKIQKEGVTSEFYKWVDRETFHANKEGDDWYAGLIKTVWSFGNNSEKGYLFGKEIENTKRLMHEVVVNKCENSLNELNNIVMGGGYYRRYI
jgi:adenine-specific DNA methylase